MWILTVENSAINYKLFLKRYGNVIIIKIFGMLKNFQNPLSVLWLTLLVVEWLYLNDFSSEPTIPFRLPLPYALIVIPPSLTFPHYPSPFKTTF